MNKQKHREYSKEWYKKNKEEIDRKKKIYYQKNKKKVIKCHKEYYQKNIERERKKGRERQRKNKPYFASYQRKYYKLHKNKDKIMIRHETRYKYGKLPKGFVYHHTTEPYNRDIWIGVAQEEHSLWDSLPKIQI